MSTPFLSFQRLIFYMRPHRVKVVAAVICTVLHNIFDVFPELLVGMTIDVLVNKHHSFLGHFGIQNPLHQLYGLALLTFIIWMLEALCEYMSDLLWRGLAQMTQHELRLDAYAHMQELEMVYFEDKSVGDILTALNDDINQLEHFFDKGVSDFIYFVVSVIIVGCVFFYLSPVVAFFAFLPVPIILFIAYRFQHRLGFLYTHVRKCAGSLGARITNNIIGIATIKSYTTEKFELERLRNESNAYKQSSESFIAVSAAFIPIVRIAIAFGFVMTIILGGWYTLHGSLAVGAFSVLISMTQRLLWPFIYLAQSADIYKRAMACAQRVFAILDTPIAIKDNGNAQSVVSVKGKIEFKDISFTYPNGIKIFDNLSISIDPGQTVGIVGSTGSGKTTLIKLLLRFYDPVSGSILLDGLYTKDLQLQGLRQSFGLVSQEIFLFEGSIKENIAYGTPQVTNEEIVYAAQIAEIHDYIMSLPYAYETMINERGQKLSGGQRQRLAIARALVNRPPIFIFDEATSSVDNETEAAIQRSLHTLSKNHTIFIIAHRLSTIRHADAIFVLHKGAVVENGTHAALLNQNGLYAQLWRAQFGER